MFKANDTIQNNKAEEYLERISFISKQIEKCTKNIEKNLYEIKNTKNKKEILILQDTTELLERKIEYLMSDIEETKKIFKNYEIKIKSSKK